MNTKNIKTKICLRYDSYTNWTSTTGAAVVLEAGEIGICYIPTNNTVEQISGTQPPQIMFKVGDGTSPFSALPWASAKAADVYSWAKAETKPTYEIDEILGAGALENLETENKDSIVGAINEVLRAVAVGGTGSVVTLTSDSSDGVTTYTIKQGDSTVGTISVPDAYDDAELVEAINAINDETTGILAQAILYANGKVASVQAADNSITVAGTATAPTVAVKLSADADNALALKEDGLKVTIPAAEEYSIVKAENSGDYAAIYNLTKNGAIVGASINIPKDLVVKSGSVVDDEIVLILNDDANTEIKIPVGSLIEYVTSGSQTGDMVVINVSDDHKVTATITDGTVTKAKLATDVQTSLGKADTAVQPAALNDYYTKEAAEEAFMNATETGSAIDAKIAALNLTNTYEPKGAEANAKAYADGLAGNYATAAQGAKADTALQEVGVGEGLIAMKEDNKVTVEIDPETIFILNCGSASSAW